MAQEAQESKGIVKDLYDEKGKQSTENRLKGGEDVVISLVNKTKVEFIKDFGQMKKGHVQEVSDVAFEIYDKQKAIKKV